jgi:hypothetical protein
MARQVKQTIPQPPAEYDQEYIARLVSAVNAYMFQREAQGEMIAGRYICTSMPGDADGTAHLPTGTLYTKPCPTCGADVVCVVKTTDP